MLRKICFRIAQKKFMLKSAELPPRKISARLGVVSVNWQRLAKELPVSTRKRKRSVVEDGRAAVDGGTAAASGKARKLGSAGPEVTLAKEVAVDEVWFDGVDAADLERARDGTVSVETKAKRLSGGIFTGETKHVAIDCEMVGVGRDGVQSQLARCSIVNRHGNVLLDTYVKPKDFVTDLRTQVSGIRFANIRDAPSFEEVQAKVAKIMTGKILVGHGVKNDLDVLLLSHPRKDLRDTSKFRPFKKFSKGRTPGLKLLSQKVLGLDIQGGEHSSVEDAQAVMAIYRAHAKAWEEKLRSKSQKNRPPKVAG